MVFVGGGGVEIGEGINYFINRSTYSAISGYLLDSLVWDLSDLNDILTGHRRPIGVDQRRVAVVAINRQTPIGRRLTLQCGPLDPRYIHMVLHIQVLRLRTPFCILSTYGMPQTNPCFCHHKN